MVRLNDKPVCWTCFEVKIAAQVKATCKARKAKAWDPKTGPVVRRPVRKEVPRPEPEPVKVKKDQGSLF